MARSKTKLAGVVSLGCAKNLVDTEYLVGGLGAGGWGVVPDRDRADLLLVNTCSFIGPAVEESREAIAEALAWKAGRPGRVVVVAGCLVNRFGPALERDHPGVDLFLAPGQIPRLGAWLALPAPRPRRLGRGGKAFLAEGPLDRTLTTGAFAYLKVSDGCTNRCSYCLIPAIRGPHRSRSLGAVLAEAAALVEAGAAEVNVVGQDITRYGEGRRGGGLPGLVRALGELPGDFRIRLLYLHPERVDDAVLGLFGEVPRLLPYLDMPIQHASSRVLRAMNRRYDRRGLSRAVERARARVPGIALRTTVMVGHPGEGRREFRELLAFLEDHPFENLGAFAFSPQPGTPAASMPGAAPPEEAAERLREVMTRQAATSGRLWRLRRGSETEALLLAPAFDRDAVWTGRTAWQAPEVDGQVVLRGPGVPGAWVRCRITGSSAYDLEGRILPGAAAPGR